LFQNPLGLGARKKTLTLSRVGRLPWFFFCCNRTHVIRLNLKKLEINKYYPFAEAGLSEAEWVKFGFVFDYEFSGMERQNSSLALFYFIFELFRSCSGLTVTLTKIFSFFRWLFFFVFSNYFVRVLD
jgi:hypothetical protein